MHLRKATKTLPAILLSLLPSIALAQSDDGGGEDGSGISSDSSTTFLQDYVDFLNQSGYTSLSNALVQANQTESGQEWLAQIGQQQVQNESGDVGVPWTVFVPNNQAFESVPDSVTQNATLLSEFLSYHFVYGNLQNTTASEEGGDGETMSTTGELIERYLRRDDSSNPNSDGLQLLSGVYPNTTIGRMLLNDLSWVQLEGDKSQVLVWTRSGEDGNVTVLNQPGNVTVVNGFQWRSFFIAEINGVLTPPGNVTTALVAVNDAPLLNFGSQIPVPLNDGSNGSAIEFLQEARGFTLFAPESEAFTNDVNQTIQQLQGNQTALAALLQNHYINGTTVYSPALMQLGVDSSSPNADGSSSDDTTTYYSAAGQPFTFSYNSSGLFVSHGDSYILAARVTRPDILVDNGVIHLIDRVLFDTQANSDAASSAYASATSAAAQTSTDAYAIGTSPIPAPAETTSTDGGDGQTSSAQELNQTSSESGDTTTESPAATPSSFRIRRGLRIPE